MSRSWLFILMGGMVEAVWAVFMKMSDGFTVPLYTALTIAFLFVSVILMNMGLKRGLPVGPAYAVWVGIGAVMSVVSGILLFGETISLLGFVFLAMVIGGIVGLNLVTDES